jgi:KipI family sensor histidine kinase inhibitor
VAATLGLAPAEVVALLVAAPLRVMMIGFAPGYPYLGPLPAALQLPRRATPRQRVPAGSVAIAAGLAGIYPAALPGGWHLVGRTDARLFDPQADPPALLAPGDYVQFVAL